MTKEGQEKIITRAIHFIATNTKEESYRIGQAIIAELELVKNCSTLDVVKSLPTDECVEQWWAEGQDQNKGFWKEAPYRTNGDVVEEIKTALKYFITVWQ
jgi:hypothetical protein